jgi:anti-sigma B factor antagonist
LREFAKHYQGGTMSAPQVTFTVRKANDKTSIIDIKGEVTAAAEKALMDAYTQATSKTESSIVLNFSGMEYMNSSGIGLLVTLLIRVNRHKQKLLTFGLNEHYKQIFALTRLNDAIKNFNSEAQAVANA